MSVFSSVQVNTVVLQVCLLLEMSNCSHVLMVYVGPLVTQLVSHVLCKDKKELKIHEFSFSASMGASY